MIGRALWVAQPLYLVLEIVVGLHASPDYRFGEHTVSDLGNTSCRTVDGAVLCSPWHDAMNAGFVWFGCTLALGALLTHAPGRFLWVVAGVGSVGVGLVPVVENPALHGLVALPVFVAQPLALLVMARDLHHRWDPLRHVVTGAAAVSAVGALAFAGAVTTEAIPWEGAFERAALWPSYVIVSGWALTRTRATGEL